MYARVLLRSGRTMVRNACVRACARAGVVRIVVRTRVRVLELACVVVIGRCLAAVGRAIGEYRDTPVFHAASKLITDLLLEEGFLPNRVVVCGVKAATSAGAALLSGALMNGRESAAAHTHIGDGSRWLMSSDPAPQRRADRRPFSATPNDRSAPRSAKLLGGTAGVLTATPTHVISLGCAGRTRATTRTTSPFVAIRWV